MEQVYYTQCPMGHGLGATGGFQLKRISPGYPRTADFRHLGMRVRMSGLNVASPKVLRYRRAGEWFEIAWLAPRIREFEVATGDGQRTRLYGRPGGLFAHGLRLDPEAMRTLDHWPASLHGWPLWVESDPVPTAGRFLDPMVLDEATLAQRHYQPRFSEVAALAEPWGLDFLADLLARVAEAVRSNRALFLIDAPGAPDSSAIGPLIALLTFAFPPGMREELTFSTYHDRPEGLAGFRIQGVPSQTRPDNSALRALGIVADLGSRTTSEPGAPGWAIQLARWFVERDEVAWEVASQDLAHALIGRKASQCWQEDWLDQAIHFRERNAWPPERLTEGSARRAWHGSATWAMASGLARDWSEAHPPSWWEMAAARLPGSKTLAASLVLQGRHGRPGFHEGRSGESVRPDPEQARAWGAVVASWFGGRSQADWFTALQAFLARMPAEGRLAFLDTLNEAAPERADTTLEALERARLLDPVALLTLRGLRALKPEVDPERLVETLDRAWSDGTTWRPVLASLAREVSESSARLDALGRALARSLRPSRLQRESQERRARLFPWALDLPAGPRLLAESLRDAIVTEGDRSAFGALLERMPTSRGPTLLDAALGATLRPPTQGPEFRWLVEATLLARRDGGKAPLTRWADAYLGLFDSDLPLHRRLFGRAPTPGLRSWLTRAEQAGELSEDQRDRLRRVESFHEALNHSRASDPTQVPLLAVRVEERPGLLRTLLEAPGHQSLEALIACLVACQASWSAAVFREPSAERSRLAAPIAEALFRLDRGGEPRFGPRLDHDAWNARLDHLLDALGVPSEPLERYRAEGLAAEINAATARLDPMETEVWNFRRDWLRDPNRYRGLAADIRQDLHHADIEGPSSVFDQWDHDLEVGTRTAAFFEVFLNACDDNAFLELAPRLADRTRGWHTPLPWWDAGAFGQLGADLRERFARLAPMRPHQFEDLLPILTWFEPEALRLAPLPGQPPDWPRREAGDLPHLSAPARDRWIVLEALSNLASRDWLQWSIVLQELEPLPIARLATEDRYSLASWLIMKVALDAEPSLDDRALADTFRRFGLDDPDRIAHWFEALPPDTPGLRDRILSRREFVEGLAQAILG